MFGGPGGRDGACQSCPNQPLAREEAQQTPDGCRRVLAAHQGKLLRPAADKISNLRGSEVAPIRVVLPDADRSHLATRRLIQPTIKPKAVVVHSAVRSLLLPATRLVARRDSQNYAEKIKSGLSPAPTSHPPVPNPSASTRHNPALGIRPLGLNRFAVFM